MTRQPTQDKKSRPISDDAVKKATGKTAAQWFAVMDGFGARKMPHKDIARRLAETHPDISGWWSQMITVLYEQERGMRQKHQTTSGFQVSASKTVPIALDMLFHSWTTDDIRQQWLDPASVTVRSATPQKYLHMAWKQDKSSIDINFYPKGDGKSQVTVQHSKLPDAQAGEKMKAYWKGVLDLMQQALAS
ncbi:MAG: hypothetical protein FJ320_01935 [SAR202 cluster bacterium]|nr:hypothetical protein [SAR202 cluster bacterium]